jgi:hypothetical protein
MNGHPRLSSMRRFRNAKIHFVKTAMGGRLPFGVKTSGKIGCLFAPDRRMPMWRNDGTDPGQPAVRSAELLPIDILLLGGGIWVVRLSIIRISVLETAFRRFHRAKLCAYVDDVGGEYTCTGGVGYPGMCSAWRVKQPGFPRKRESLGRDAGSLAALQGRSEEGCAVDARTRLGMAGAPPCSVDLRGRRLAEDCVRRCGSVDARCALLRGATLR